MDLKLNADSFQTSGCELPVWVWVWCVHSYEISICIFKKYIYFNFFS